MAGRKKWTPTAETEGVLHAREKKKWQIALRRYLLEKQPSTRYAPYFGLDVERFREWIALQFDEGLVWENFGTHWQLEHVLPSQYFDLTNEAECRLCWNFINIKVERVGDSAGTPPGALGVLSYFEHLAQTQNPNSLVMVEKIKRIMSEVGDIQPCLTFLSEKQIEIQQLSEFTEDEMLRVNRGESLESIVMEKEILKKFGS